MSKTKPKVIKIENEDQYAAYCITTLLATINPAIDKELTYDLVWDYIVDPDEMLTPNRAVELGQLILISGLKGPEREWEIN